MAKKKKIKNSIDDDIFELSLGSLLIVCNDFSSDIFIEKIFVLLGILLSILGIIRAIVKYKKQDKKGLVIFLGVLGVLFGIAFFGLLYRLLFI